MQRDLQIVRFLISALMVCAMGVSSAPAQNIAERSTLFSSAGKTPFRAGSWNMNMGRREGGRREGGVCLWFNTDWQAKPWAGVKFDADDAPSFTLTKDWIENGFVRFLLNSTVTRDSVIGGGDQYQVKPHVEPPLKKHQVVRSQFIDRGRGIDQEASTWQEVLVPLKYFTDLKPGHRVSGLSIQTYRQISMTFSLDDVEYVRFDMLPGWMVDQLNQKVIQDWVEWPEYDDLPEVAKADRRPLSVRDGSFVTPDGKRGFLLNPYCREDSRSNLGVLTPGKLTPTHGLYDRKKHGWIYDEVLTNEYLCRLGFNSYSATPVPTLWWRSVGYAGRRGGVDEAFLSTLSQRVTLPYFVDLVSWPYTMGKPGLIIGETDLPPSAATKGRNHWTQYRTIGAGRDAWMKMWAVNARRYRDAGVKVAIVELMNEPAYMGETPDHHAEFEDWLKQRHGTVKRVNETWKTDYKSLKAASAYRFSHSDPAPMGQTLDYDEYLSERFEELIGDGVEAVTDILPGALVGLQTMGGYMRSPQQSVWKHRIARRETVVLTPTGGGRWTRGSGALRPSHDLTSHPMADAPIENDLLLAVAGDKMIVDNETSLRGQRRIDTRNRLWEHVVCGLDGLTIFSWSKRGWVWWEDRGPVQTDADKFPYSSLIPIARRTDALRGILDFSVEVQTLAPRILPKPWGPAPKIGLLYSWDNARRRETEKNTRDRCSDYYAALRYSHWNMAMLPADRLIDEGAPEGMDVIVAVGLTHVERELPDALREFVSRGGILILGECDLGRDIHDMPIPSAGALAPETKGAARKSVGRGSVYYQNAGVFGYSLAKTLRTVLEHAGGGNAPDEWRSVGIRDRNGRLAPNVLVSRRSYDGHHAILLHNRDQYERVVRVAVPGLKGQWRVTSALDDSRPRDISGDALGTEGVEVTLAPAGPAVLLIDRR